MGEKLTQRKSKMVDRSLRVHPIDTSVLLIDHLDSSDPIITGDA